MKRPLNRLVCLDDCQCTQLHASKLYAEIPRVDVVVEAA